MKRLLVLLSFLSVAMLCAAEFVKNADFSKVSPQKLPESWNISADAGSKVEVTDGVLYMKPLREKDRALLIQHGIQLPYDTPLLVSYEAMAEAGAVYRIYIEGTQFKDGQKAYCSFLLQPTISGTGQFEKITDVITIPAEWQNPYIVIRVIGDKAVRFKNLQINEIKDVADFNFDFAVRTNGIPIRWAFRGNTNLFKFSDNQAVLTPQGQNIAMIYYNLNKMIPCLTYDLSLDVRGDEGGKFKAYIEWALRADNGKGKYLHSASSGSNWHLVNKEWTTIKAKLTLPAEFSSVLFAFFAESDGTVEVRNLKIAPNASEAGMVREAGGIWNFGNVGSQVEGEHGKMTEVKSGGEAILCGIPVKPVHRYRLSYQVVGVGQAANESGFHYFTLKMRFNDGTTLPAPTDDVGSQLQDKWFTFAIPPKASVLNVACTTANGATVRLKNFRLTEEPLRPEDNFKIVITEPAYRNAIYDGMKVKAISGEVIAPKGKVKDVRFASDKDNFSKQVRLTEDNGRTFFTIPVGELPDATYTLTAVVTSLADGKDYNITETLVKLPKTKNEVTADGKGNFFFNGKPFYPIVLMTPDISVSEHSIYQMARAGFNVVRIQGTAESLKRALAIAERFNVKLVVSFDRLGKSSDEHAQWKHRVHEILPEIKEHPALFGYFLVDEPAWAGIPLAIVTEGYHLLKKLDPYHPVWINAAPRGSTEEHSLYATGADIYGLDIYPVPYPNSHSNLDDQTMTCVGKYTRQMHDAVDGRKTIWMVLQGFAWGTLNGNVKLVYPTPQETRFMVFDALTSGSTSIAYWGTQYIENPQFYRELFAQATELHQLSGLLAEAEVTKVEQFGTVHVYTYTGKEDIATIAINRSDKAVAAHPGKFPALDAFGVDVSGKIPAPVNELPAYNVALETPRVYEEIANSRDSKKWTVYDYASTWIWDAHVVKGETVAAALVIDIEKLPAKAELLGTADDKARFFVNGKNCGQSLQWDMVSRFDIRPLLKVGKNIIVFEGTDIGALPCGILGGLLFDGIFTATGKEWKTKVVPFKSAPDYSDPAMVDDWQNAHIIAPFGSGVWGGRLKLEKDAGK